MEPSRERAVQTMSISSTSWECQEASAVKARAGFRTLETGQERRVLMPSCVPYKAPASNFEALTTPMTTALQATSIEWTPVASDGGGEWKQPHTARLFETGCWRYEWQRCLGLQRALQSMRR